MLPFKKGAFVTAINAGVPIVPVACSSYLKGFDMNNLDNSTARLRVLPAVSTKGCSQENVKELMDRIHSDMMDTINELDATQASR
jgi:1-acyl-sn-glycerol-3-phosphate acyltransferase